MSDYLFECVLRYLKNQMPYISKKNNQLNLIEEYIEWLNYSQERFQKNYNEYLDILKEYQAKLLLNEFVEADLYLHDKMLYYNMKQGE